MKLDYAASAVPNAWQSVQRSSPIERMEVFGAIPGELRAPPVALQRFATVRLDRTQWPQRVRGDARQREGRGL